MKAIRKACLDAQPMEPTKNAIVPVPTELSVQEDELLKTINNSEESSVELTANEITLHVTEQTSSTLLAKVLGVIAQVE